MKTENTYLKTENPNLKAKDPLKSHSRAPENHGILRIILSRLLEIHNHRVYRGILCSLLILHIFILFAPLVDTSISIPHEINLLCQFFKNLWPLPTFAMSGDQEIVIRNIVLKGFEIVVLLLYTIDLLPKIFVWKKPFIWKMINVFVVTIMVLQVPLMMIGFQEAGVSTEKLKLRICSICLSFLLLCEIFSIKEKRTIRQEKEKRHEIQRKNQEIKQKALEAQNKKQENKEMKSYSWLEIVRHDRPGDCWVVIHGKVYDLSNFVHPGGPMIYDGCGGDCTPFWESYHPLELTKRGPPQKYLIGHVRDYHDFYSWDGDFYSTLKQRVEDKIPKNKRQNEWSLILKGAIILTAHLICTGLFWYYHTLWSAVLYGFVAGQLGVNIMHDGNHMAWTSNKTISLIAGYTLDLTFSTSVVYRRSHNFGHHGCVNHLELETAYTTTFPLMRLHHLQKRLPMHRFQHLYIWLLYGTVNFGDMFGTFDELFWLSNFPARRGSLTKTSYYTHALVKLTWFIFEVFVQLYRFGFYEWFPVLFAYFVCFSYGYVFFFAINHWTDEANTIDNSQLNSTNWGVLQVENSSNFACKSKFWTHLSGGLNHQIEHHLFPHYAHTRLPEITDIVKDECKKRNIRYFEFPSFWKAMYGHYKLLRDLGQNDELPNKKKNN